MLNQFELLSLINDGVWCINQTSHEVIFFNKQLTAILPDTAPSAGSDIYSLLQILEKGERADLKTHLKKLSAGESFEFEHSVSTVDGTRWLSQKATFFSGTSSSNPTNYIVGIVKDITEKKRSDSKLLELEEQVNYLFDNNPNPLWVYDRETLQFLAVNDAAIAGYGYSKEEFLQMTICDIRPEEEIPRLLNNLKSSTQTFTQSKYWRHIKKDRRIIYVNITAHAITYKGRPAEMVLPLDVTQQVENQQEVYVTKNNLDGVINNTNDLIWSIDKDYKIISANNPFKTYCKFLYNSNVRIGDSVFIEHLDESLRAYWRNYYDRALAGETFVTVENSDFQGVLSTMEVRYNPIFRDDEVIGVGCFSRDITEWVETKNELLDQNERLREIASLASHDIRGPVTTLMGLVNLFNKKNLADPFNENLIDCIETTTHQLDSVIHKIVDKTYRVEHEEETTSPALQSRLKNE